MPHLEKLVRLVLFGLVMCFFMSGCQHALLSINSPDNTLFAELSTDSTGRLYYSVERNGAELIEKATLGLIVDEVDLGKNVKIGSCEFKTTVDKIYRWRGVHSTAQNNYNEVVVPVTHLASEVAYHIEMRVFNDGIAYRTILPGKGKRMVDGEVASWQISKEAIAWYHSDTRDYEDPIRPTKVADIAKGAKMAPPVVLELPKNNGYLALTEASLFEYSGFILKSSDEGQFQVDFEDDPHGWTMQDTITTPWRIAIISPDLNGLVNSDMIHNVCPPPAPELANADWIRPGRSVWSWWSSGTGDWNQQKRYVDRAAELGFEYNLVDELWETWKSGQKDKWDLLKEVVDYAKKKNVNIWVWKYWQEINTAQQRLDFFKKVKKVGAVGVKIDFMESDSKDRIDFYTATLRDAAKFQLMINFHGANKPTGESRTFPHEMTREGIYGLENNKGDSIPAFHNAALPFTRYIAGHGDYTPCTFNPEKLRGTSFAHQLATTIVFTSPVTHWADQPDNYLASIAVDVIKKIPTCWDETRVLPGSSIGEIAAFARRKGENWYVGVLNGGDERNFKIDLSFLGTGHYETVTFSDDLKRPDDLLRQEMVLDDNATLTTVMHAGGGYVAQLIRTDKPLAHVVIQHDGLYLKKPAQVTLTIVDPNSSIYYSLDGSMPTMNSTHYKDALSINEPVILRAVSFKNGERNCLSEARFVRPHAPDILTPNGLFMTQKTVEIDRKEHEGTLYYTLDGTDPTESSFVYKKPFEISDTSVLRAKIIWQSGFCSDVNEANYTRPEPRKPEIPGKLNKGLQYLCYLARCETCADIRSLSATKSGIVNDFDIQLSFTT